jgi:signal recognition particle receptor subunit beta
MAFTNFDTKEINCKIVYFGPKGAGKMTNFRSIYNATASEVTGGLLDLDAKDGDTRFFSFLPISMGHVKDFHLKIHLFILPQNRIYETVPSVILKGIDGYVFVADSRVEKMSENIESLLEAKRLLTKEGHNVEDMPRVVQYNKRDLPGIVPVQVLKKELNSSNAPDHEAIADQSIGTLETLQAVAKQVIRKLAD